MIKFHSFYNLNFLTDVIFNVCMQKDFAQKRPSWYNKIISWIKHSSKLVKKLHARFPVAAASVLSPQIPGKSRLNFFHLLQYAGGWEGGRNQKKSTRRKRLSDCRRPVSGNCPYSTHVVGCSYGLLSTFGNLRDGGFFLKMACTLEGLSLVCVSCLPMRAFESFFLCESVNFFLPDRLWVFIF